MKLDVFGNTVKSSIWGVFEKVFMLFCAFIVRTVIIYKLGSEYVGLEGLFSSILTILNLSELGFGSAIVFFMYRCIVEEDNETINQLLYLIRKSYQIIALLISLAGIIVSFFLKSLIHGDVPDGMNIYILFFMYLFNTVSMYLFAAYRTSVFTAYQRNDIKAKIQIIVDIIMYSLQVVVLLLFSNYYLYVGVMLLTIIPKNFLYYWYSKRSFPLLNPSTMPNKALTKEVLNRILPLLGHKIGGAFLVSIDSVIISAFLGLESLGKYNNYYYIITAIIGLTSIVQQALVAGIGNKIIILNDKDVYDIYLKTSFVWRWVIGQCAISFLCLIQPFVKVWIGDSFILPFYIAITLTVYYYLWQFRIIGMTFKDAAGLWKNDWYKPYVGMFLNTIVSILMVYHTKDMIFVLIPTCFVFLFLYFPVESLVISKDIFHINISKVIVPNILHTITIVLAGIGTYYCCAVFSNGTILSLIIRFLISIIVPNILLVSIWYHSSTFKSIIPYLKLLIRR